MSCLLAFVITAVRCTTSLLKSAESERFFFSFLWQIVCLLFSGLSSNTLLSFCGCGTFSGWCHHSSLSFVFTVRLHVMQRTVLLSQFCPSGWQMYVLRLNEVIICKYLNTIQNRNISSLSTPTGVARNCPLPPEIFTKSDPSGLKCSADNCTVNCSNVGTAHSSRTISLR